jgi:hypothetical protein
MKIEEIEGVGDEMGAKLRAVGISTTEDLIMAGATASGRDKVDSPAELAQRSAANLAETFQEPDAARPNTVRRVPSLETVEEWITIAKGMQETVSH